MNITRKLPDDIVSKTSKYFKIGKIIKDNSGLPYLFIKDLSLGLYEFEKKEVTAYEFG